MDFVKSVKNLKKWYLNLRHLGFRKLCTGIFFIFTQVFFYVNFFVLKKWELFFLLFFFLFYRGRHQVCIKPKKKTLQTSTPSRSAASKKKGKNNFRKSRIVVEENFHELDEMSMVSDRTVYNRRWNTTKFSCIFSIFWHS